MRQINKYFVFSSLIYKSVSLLQLIILAYMFRSSAYFSQSFEQTQMRLIDDYAMQFGVYNFQSNMIGLDLQRVFFYYEYAYGWLFWFVFGCLTLPFRLMFKYFPSQLSEQLLIISVRSVNIVIIFVTLLLLTKILRKILVKEMNFLKTTTSLLAITIILTPTFGYWSGRPMPPILAATILLLGIYIGIENRNIETNKILLVAAIFGLAIGIKINYLMYVPLCILLIIETRRTIYGDFRIKLGLNPIIFKTIFIFLLSIVFSLSPALLFDPIQGFPKVINTFNLFRSLSTSNQVGSFEQFLDNFVNGIVLSGFGFIPQLALFLVTLYLLFEKISGKARKRSLGLLLIISLYILICEILLSYHLGLGKIYVQSYSLPILLFLPIYFLIILREFMVNTRKILSLGISLFVLVMINFTYTLKLNDSSFPTIYAYQYMDKQAHKASLFKLQKEMQSEIKLGEQNIEIIQDYTLPTAWSGFRKQVALTYAYNDWEKKSLKSNSHYLYLIIDRKNPKLRDDMSRESSLLHSNTSDQILENIISSRTFLDRNCKLEASRTRYFLFTCVPSTS